MEEEIVREIIKECKNWKERVLVRLFKKEFTKVYHIGRLKVVDCVLKVMQ